MSKKLNKITPYQTKTQESKAGRYGEAKKEALNIFSVIKKRTKRRPYVRSAYFSKQKIFFDYFWQHVFQKSSKERFKRLKYFEAAIELMRNSRNQPVSKINPNKKDEILHRFAGLTKDKKRFYVQIKEDIKTDKKYFMSCFPAK